MSHLFKRVRHWVDPAVQSPLLIRMAAYFLIYTVTLLHVGFAIDVLRKIVWSGEETRVGDLYLDFLSRQSSLLIGMVVIVPVLLYDLVKFSHRIVGPLYRCRRMMYEMASGKPVPEFIPREHDLMTEFFQAFNALIKAWNARVETAPDNTLGDAHKPMSVLAQLKAPCAETNVPAR